MNNISFKQKFIPAIAWFFVVLYIMCLPGKEIPQVGWLESINFDKLVHVGVFALLTFLFCWPFYKSSFTQKERLSYFLKITIASSVWGLVIELLQKYFIPGRNYDLIDWLADSLGSLIAYIISRKTLMK